MGNLFPLSLTQPLTASNFDGFLGSTNPTDQREHNFCRVHQTLRVTPAMEAGLTNHVWTLQELVSLLEYKELKKAA
jgi:hypothetical protein